MCAWVMSHLCMSHVTQTQRTPRLVYSAIYGIIHFTYEWDHVTHLHESCHTYSECTRNGSFGHNTHHVTRVHDIISHICMSYVTPTLSTPRLVFLAIHSTNYVTHMHGIMSHICMSHATPTSRTPRLVVSAICSIKHVTRNVRVMTRVSDLLQVR